MGRIHTDLSTIVLTLLPIFLIIEAQYYDLVMAITIFGGGGLIILTNLLTMILYIQGNENKDLWFKLDITAIISSFIMLFGFITGYVLSPDAVISFLDWNALPFGFYFLMSFNLLILIILNMNKVENSIFMLLSIPVLILSLIAQFLIVIWDIIFPSKMREYVPYLDVTRTLVLSMTQIFADEDRLKTEQTLNTLGDLTGQVDGIAEGYHLRKSIGQGIDIGLTIVVFAFFGVLAVLTDLGIPPSVVALLFSSLALALSTFAGLFGPFYGIAGAAKQFSLRHGNYRAASIYKLIENLFSIPFNVATAGFLFLDLPPIDAETLEDFKGEMQEQLTDITDTISSLLGRDKSAIPRKTRKMIGELLGSAENNLANLDFRNIREETAREFALTYYQHEFSWKPWERKRAVTEFADEYYFDVETGESNLRLIGDKIKAGQMDDDMVNNVMISAALRGIIKMEQKYQEILADVELGQTCTGLAFGARQFLKDHYVVRSTSEKWLLRIKNLFFGIFAVPIVLATMFHTYANRFFDESIKAIRDGIFLGRIFEVFQIRRKEIYSELKNIPEERRRKAEEKEKNKSGEEEKKQRNWQFRRWTVKLLGMIWEVIVFPFTVIFGIMKRIYKKIFAGDDISPREQFEEAVAHAALVAMYNELFQSLVMQTNVAV